MKLSSIIASLLLTAFSASAFAAPDRTYYVTELAPQQKFDVYNDGRNTFLQSIPGLIVTGATADGEFFIVKGVPSSIRGFMNGKPITVVRGLPPQPKPVTPDPAVVNAQIKRLTDKLDALTAQIPAKSALGAKAGTPVSASADVGPAQNGAAASARTADAGSAAGAPTADAGAAANAPRRPTIADVYTYRVTPNDENFRLLVERWSKVVGWTAIWDVDRDILISTSGEKAGDWKTAIRWVLSSSKFGDLAVKPCFYNNSVVRIVRETVKCKPNE